MKNLIRPLIAAGLSAFMMFQSDAGYVKGYTRKDGTYVAPHYSKSSKRTYAEAIADTPRQPRGTTVQTTRRQSSYTGKSYEVYLQRQTQGSRTFSKSMRQKKFDEQGGNCAHCGTHCESVGKMDGDHIVPYSKGGKTEYSNLQMLCPHCNRSKGNKGSY